MMNVFTSIIKNIATLNILLDCKPFKLLNKKFLLRHKIMSFQEKINICLEKSHINK